MESRRQWARRWIVVGFVITVAGILTNWIATLTVSTFGDFGLANTIDDVVYPLTALSTLVAWWFLSNLFASRYGAPSPGVSGFPMARD
jgi:hypothetical protein